MPLEQHVRDFITHCQAAALSPKSIDWYQRNLQRFVTFVGDKDFTDPNLLNEYAAALHTRTTRFAHHPKRNPIEGGLAPESIRGHIRTIKIFFHWLAQENKIVTNPAVHLPMPRKSKAIPRGIKPADFDALFSAATTSKSATRDQAILLLLRDTGCRASEIANLFRTDLDLNQGIILVRGKGGQERFAFLSPPTQRAIAEWLKQSKPNDYLFCTRRGGRFTAATLSQMLRRLKRHTGITGKANPHSFRHAFARDYLQNGGDLASLSQTLGHRDLATTMIYATMTTSDLQAKHAKYSPLAKHSP